MQKKQKLVFNQKTLLFESVQRKPFYKKYQFYGAAIIVLGLLYFLPKVNLSQKNIDTQVSSELKKMEEKYSLLDQKLNDYSKHLDAIHKKDAQVYSLVMGIEPMDESIWQAGTGGKHSVRNRLANMMNLNIGKIEDKANKLNHQLKLQSKSLDNLYKNAVAHEKFLNSLPSIKPVKAESLNRDVALLSGYGRRLHPVFRIWRKHTGIDFSCPKGTQIVATGQGVVSKINGNGRGYGKHVLIDHGYGYQTLYAHMSDIDVREGQKVERGTPIGKVGSTGTATAPHLHYEVRKNGEPINPIDFVLDGLSSTEYAQMLKQAAIEGKSMD
ncbi:MAG: peptidoglycan DD-metalloendopeptidase family protein [Bacteroidetes bacterium]|nr:peptidoglycan DD-metalloendopeptidase family protein [Bacteroidota bacterium]